MTNTSDVDEKQSLVGDSERVNKCKVKDIIFGNESLFYCCALISSWDDRSWFFLIGIYLISLDPSNLILSAIYGFLSSACVLLFGSLVGSLIDKTARLKASYVVLCFRNLSTLLSSVTLCLVFLYYDVIMTPKYRNYRIAADVILVATGILAHFTGLINNTMLTKDWLAVFCIGNNHLLASMTSRFRVIDLVCNIVAPVVIGIVMTYAGRKIASLIFSVQVSLTLILFCYLLRVIYNRIPRLHYRQVDQKSKMEKQHVKYNSVETSNVMDIERPSVRSNSFVNKLFTVIDGWRMYFKLNIVLAGLALALLYMTVLGFDTITIGYATSQGMDPSILSFFNAGAATTGVLGAIVYPFVVKCSNVVITGIVGLFFQFSGLIPCAISVWAPGSPFNFTLSSTSAITIETNGTFSTISPYVSNAWSLSLMLLFGGIVISRFGLWMFDLAVTQIYIETVIEEHRGKVNGVQNSLNMLFDMIKFALVLFLSQPHQFGILILLSVSAIMAANILYLVFALIHKCKI